MAVDHNSGDYDYVIVWWEPKCSFNESTMSPFYTRADNLLWGNSEADNDAHYAATVTVTLNSDSCVIRQNFCYVGVWIKGRGDTTIFPFNRTVFTLNLYIWRFPVTSSTFSTAFFQLFVSSHLKPKYSVFQKDWCPLFGSTNVKIVTTQGVVFYQRQT